MNESHGSSAPRESEINSSAIDIVKIAGAFAAVSALTVFLASLASVMYTRGLFSEFGFPASATSAKAAADMFTVIAYQHCLLAVGFGILGFVPLPRSLLSAKTHRLAFAAMLMGAILLSYIGAETGSQSRLLRIPTGATAALLPLTVGYAFRSTPNTLARYGRVLSACLVAVLAFSVNLRAIGAGHAIKVIASGLSSDKGPAEDRLAKSARDFGVVTLISKEELPFLPSSKKIDGGYEYAPKPEEFVRFVAEDESKYFLLEKRGPQTTAFMVRKEIIAAVVFVPNSAIPRPLL